MPKIESKTIGMMDLNPREAKFGYVRGLTMEIEVGVNQVEDHWEATAFSTTQKM